METIQSAFEPIQTNMLALSIRQPFAELILRGIKTVEYRSRATKIVGQRFHIYASRKKWSVASGQWSAKAWSEDLAVDRPPQWMIELAEQIGMIEPDTTLPTGVIVGSAVIEKVEEIATERRSDVATEGPEHALSSSPSSLRRSVASSLYKWHLADVERAKKLRKPIKHPQPVWFRPF